MKKILLFLQLIFCFKYNGQTLTALGSPTPGVRTNGSLSSSEVMSIVKDPSSNDIYVGGYFNRAGSTTVQCVAKWDGTTWSALGGGLDGRVNALIFFQGTLIAGGEFNSSGGGSIFTSSLAKWNGTTWQPMGTSPGGGAYMNAAVYALAEYNGELYVGGSFNTNGAGTPLYHIAKWNGSTFVAVGGGLFTISPSAVTCMLQYGNDLFLAGEGLPSSAVWKWNGTSLSVPGANLNSQGGSGLTIHNGQLYTTAGDGLNPYRPNIWNGSSWTPMSSSGFFAGINAITSFNGEIYVGTNSNASPLIHKYNGSNWVTPFPGGAQAGGQISPDVMELQVINGDLYFGGDFNNAGSPSTQVWNIAKFSTQPGPTVSFSASSSGTICAGTCLSFTGASTGTITGWNWKFPGATNTISSIQNPTNICFNTPGTYTISLETNDSFGGGYAQQVISVVSSTLSSPFLIFGPNLVCIGSSATFSLPAVPGATSYSWTIPSGWTGTSTSNSISIQVGPTASSITVRALNSCSITSPIPKSINVAALPTVSITGSSSVCSGSSLALSASGASNYTWSTNSTSSGISVSPTVNTTYSIVGRDSNNCINTASKTISVNITPTVSVNTGVFCRGESFTLNPSGAANYTFSGGGSAVVSPSINTNYTVTGSNTVGCTAQAISNLTVLPTPTITINSGTICSGNIFTLNPTGAVSFTYSSGSNTVNPITTSTYSIIGTSSLGCVSLSSAISNVTVVPLPTVGINSGQICSGKVFTLTGIGATTYTYSSGSNTVSPVNTSTFSVSGSSLGCVSANTAVATITVLPLPVLSVSGGTICSGKTFTILPSGATTYSINGTSNNFTVNPISTTSYSISGTNSLGCITASAEVITVTVIASPVVSVTSASICAGQSFVINTTGASTYSFSGGTATVSPNSTTSYSVSGTNSLGCVSINPAISTITVFTLPTISVNSGSICSGKAFTIVPSGANTYTYSSGSSIVTPSVTSFYTVIGTSSQGCVSSNTAVCNVTVNPTPTISVNSGTICSGGQFTITPSGAFNYNVSGGSNIVSPITNTSFSVTGISAQGCVGSNTAIANVTVHAKPLISSNSGAICIGNSFLIVPSGASSYTVSGGSFSVSPTINANYSITGTSSLGCISSNTAISSVSVNPLPLISVANGTICLGDIFTMSPTGASTYSYSNGSSTVSPTTNTSYSITGTSSQGCISSNTAVCNITVNSLPLISVNNGTICSGNSFTLIPSGGVSYTFSSGSAIVTPTTNSTFTIVGADALGCTNKVVSTIIVNTSPTISANGGTLCSGSTFTLSPSGAFTYTYSSITNVVTPTVNTLYYITGSSIEGCISSNTAIVAITVLSAPLITANSGSICNGQSFVISPTGASNYSFTSGSATVTPNNTTTYTVSATNSSGCIGTAVSTVSVYPLPNITIQNGTICLGQQFILIPSGATNYTYSSGTATISPNTTTTYTIVGINAEGCLSEAQSTIFVDACLGIDELSGKNTILTLFPNPTKDNFTLKTNLELDILVTNVLGQIITKKRVSPENNTISLEAVTNGVYLLITKYGVYKIIKE